METRRSKRSTGSREALLVIDVINDLTFPGGEKVLPWAERLVMPLLRVRRVADRAKIPFIYINDNFGLWHEGFKEIYAHCTRRGSPARDIVRKLKPRPHDYFILKPRHSAFYATSLAPLLDDLGVKRLVLAGIATNLCVLFTAHDAHMRKYELVVLSDCCAAESDFDHDVALKQLERFCHATILRGDEFRPRK
ncbi:MAG TPA: isochorismatase family cysteine hydrolase [Phycisphaerae bacterium]|nr:isochorismatase family cysteine hydrolase [Phycisphaerae bacterium]